MENKIVEMVLMNRHHVQSEFVVMECSSAKIEIVHHRQIFVMVSTIVETCLMKRTVTFHALKLNSNAKVTADVFSTHGNAMEIQIVKTAVMKIRPYAVSEKASPTFIVFRICSVRDFS